MAIRREESGPVQQQTTPSQDVLNAVGAILQKKSEIKQGSTINRRLLSSTQKRPTSVNLAVYFCNH